MVPKIFERLQKSTKNLSNAARISEIKISEIHREFLKCTKNFENIFVSVGAPVDILYFLKIKKKSSTSMNNVQP